MARADGEDAATEFLLAVHQACERVSLRKGLPARNLFEPLGHTPESIGRQDYIDWASYLVFERGLKSVAREAGGLGELHREIQDSPFIRHFKGVFSFFASPTTLYKGLWSLMGPRHFPIVNTAYGFFPSQRAFLKMSLPDHVEGSEFYFENVAMAQVQAPRVINLPPSDVVKKEITTHSMDLVLAMPTSRTLAARARRLVSGRNANLEQEELERFGVDLVEARHESLRSRELFEELFAKNPEGVVIMAEGRLLHANPAFCRSMGISQESVRGTPWAAFLPEGQAPLEGEERFRVPLKTTSGEVKPCDVTRGGEVEFEGESAQFFIIRDLAHVEDLERRMEEQHRLAVLGEVAASIAHQVNTPLTVISSQLQIHDKALRKSEWGGDRAALDQALHHTMRLGATVESLIGMVRRRGGSSPPVNPGRVVAGAVGLCQSRARKLGVRLEEHSPEGELKGQVPELETTQILVNLINNGMDAVANTADACVAVFVEETSSQVRFKVRDTGANIAARVGTEIMKPFYTTKEGGTGLGLSVVKQLAAMTGARLEMNQDTPYTQFEVVFGLAETDEEKGGEGVSSSGSGANSTP